jgi:chemotaxis methyl-accepting protein methylase
LEHVRFIAADITSCELPPADIYILNDVLHYLTNDLQMTLLESCMDALPAGGKISFVMQMPI